MKADALPRQIILLVTAVLIAVLSLLWASLFSVRTAMDAEAADESRKRMAGRIASMQEQVTLIASDYHNWSDLYLDAMALRTAQLSSNYGITAERGDVFQYAELFDGPFPTPLSWSVGQGLAPQAGLLAPDTRNVLRGRIPTLDRTTRQTWDYFDIRDAQLVMFSSSYLLPEDTDLLSDVDLEETAIASIGKVLSRERLDEIATEFSTERLTFSLQMPTASQAALALNGVDGAAVGWLTWLPPKPGTELFWKMFPIMAGVSVAFVLASYYAAHLLRARAATLILREATSFSDARRDVLTGLPNRMAFQEHINRVETAEAAIIAIDLCGFKQINDAVGHIGGDIFLREFAERIARLADSQTFVARYGGDEFVIAITGTGDLNERIAEKCEALRQVSLRGISCGGVAFDVLASKGLAVRSHKDLSMEELLRGADRAMYKAKARGSQDVMLYDDEMIAEDLEHKRIEQELRKDISLGKGFEIYYQPIISTEADQGFQRFEALARWNSAPLGQIPPIKFISVAESTGLIVPLGWHLLDIILRDMQTRPDMKVNINISPAQLLSNEFATQFHERVQQYAVSADRIEIEVTEQIVLKDDTCVEEQLLELRAKGFNLALDDFGTGYSSVGYLTRMPFDVLKIDRSFVTSLSKDEAKVKVVKSMIGMARAMGMQVIVEGVETDDDLRHLQPFRANSYQGYLFGRPLPLSAHPVSDVREQRIVYAG